MDIDIAKKFNTKQTDELLKSYKDIMEEASKINESGALKGREIAIIGAWYILPDIIEIFNSVGINVTRFADNDIKKQGVTRFGITTQSVESLLNAGLDNIAVFVIAEMYWKEISVQLISLGFTKNVNFFVFKSKTESSEDDYALLSNVGWTKFKNQIASAYSCYCEIVKKYKDLPIWFMHQPSIGDLHIFSLFLPVAMNAASIRDCNCVLIVTKSHVKNYAQAIGYTNIELLPYNEDIASELLLLLRFAGDKLQIKNAVFHGASPFIQRLVWRSNLNFLDSFTKFVFGLKDKPTPIRFELPRRKNIIKKMFEEHNLVPGKTVLISPYAGVWKMNMPQEQWAALIDALIEKGYSVCTNSAGEHELPLPNTAGLFIELQDCVEFVETAGYFIGVRSGLCDIISDAKCLKIVVYDINNEHSPQDFFGFASMGIGTDIIELSNDGINTDPLIQKILTYF